MKETDIIKPENLVYEKSKVLFDVPFSFCAGCGHSTVHRLVAELIDEMGLQSDTVAVCPVGCAVLLYRYLDVDTHQSAHGRATAVATGIKRMCPDKFVFTYQGDGDLAAIGTAETIHACNRGENFLIIFINNGIYGMTGGQMAPTTLSGMKSTTSPYGRDTVTMGHPLKITDMIATMPGACYVTRQSVHTAANVRKTKKALRKAIEFQAQKKGTCVVEVVTSCPTGWRMPPVEANKWMEEHMLAFYPLGDLKTPEN